MKETNFFKLPKPEEDDFYNIKDYNEAMDILDETLEEVEEKKLDKNGNASDAITEFEQEILRENLESGEKLSVSFGKIKKWFSELSKVAFSGKALDVTEDAARRFVSDTEKKNWNGKVSTEGGDISNTKIDSLDAVTTEFPLPEEGETTKVFLGKVRKFIQDFQNFKSGIITVGKLVNNGDTTVEGYALDARYGKTLFDLYRQLYKNFKLSGDVNYYISPTGSDTTGDGTKDNPFATANHVLSLVPKNLNECTARIILLDGIFDEEVLIYGFHSGIIDFTSDSAPLKLSQSSTIKCITVINNSSRVYIHGLAISGSTPNAVNSGIYGINNTEVILQYIDILQDSTEVNTGINFDMCKARIEYCKCIKRNVVVYAYNSTIMSYHWDSRSTGNTIGLISEYGSNIHKSGTQPQATTPETHNYGGIITKRLGIELPYDVAIYVSPTGDDIIGDGTQSNPFRQPQRAIDELPKNLNGHNVWINLEDGTYDSFVMAGFHGGYMSIQSSTSPSLINTVCNVGSILVYKCTTRIHFMGLNMIKTLTDGKDTVVFKGEGCSDLYFQGCQSNQVCKAGFRFVCCGFNVRLYACKSTNAEYALQVYNSNVYSMEWVDSHATTYGIVCSDAGKCIKYGKQPTGTTLNEVQWTSGSYFNDNGTQIGEITSAGLSCTWGIVRGGYVRHGNSHGHAMVTIEVNIHPTITLNADTSYAITGFPSHAVGYDLSCAVNITSATRHSYLQSGGTLFFVPAQNITNQDILFNCTYLTNS